MTGGSSFTMEEDGSVQVATPPGFLTSKSRLDAAPIAQAGECLLDSEKKKKASNCNVVHQRIMIASYSKPCISLPIKREEIHAGIQCVLLPVCRLKLGLL